MNSLFERIKLVFADKTLRRRILFTLVALVIFRLLAAIPVPGIDTLQLATTLSNNQFLGLFNVFSGGGLANLSIVMLGVGPYITASIVMQLLTILSPKLKALYQEEGELGRKKFTQYSRLLTVPLAVVQGVAFLLLLQQQQVISHLGLFDFSVNVIIITAGSVLLMWIGELITEFGIGNGLSLIIFAGIVATLPMSVAQFAYSYDPSQLPTYIGFAIVALIAMYAIVFVTEAERPISVTYAKQVRGNSVSGGVSTYLPLRLTQAGVIPIIFAMSLLLFPQMIFNALATSVTTGWLATFAVQGKAFFENQWIHGVLYFVLVFAFTYFYTAVTFDPHQLATNLQKNGAFVPGIRPGQHTEAYVGGVLTRITLVGALFLGTVAVLPTILQSVTGITAVSIGGTALLIAVSVVLDLAKKIDAQISMREY